MLRGFASHFLLVSPSEVLRRGGVLVNDEGVLKSSFSLDDVQVEPANTSFLDGWIAPFLMDVKDVVPATLQTSLLKVAQSQNAVMRVGEKVALFNYYSDGDGIVHAQKIF